MSFFETGVQPKILKPQQQSKKSRSKPAWVSVGQSEGTQHKTRARSFVSVKTTI